MDVQQIKYPYDVYNVVKWAVNREFIHKKPPEFDEWLMALVPKECRDIVGYHVNVHTPETPVEDGWVRGYPHSHVWSVDWPPNTFSCLMYLAVAEEGGEFGLGGLERDDPYELIKPEVGMVFLFDAMRWHGVKPVTRGTRISLLTSAMPS